MLKNTLIILSAAIGTASSAYAALSEHVTQQNLLQSAITLSSDTAVDAVNISLSPALQNYLAVNSNCTKLAANSSCQIVVNFKSLPKTLMQVQGQLTITAQSDQQTISKQLHITAGQYLYLAGTFTTPYSYLLRYDGSQFSPAGVFNQPVNTLTVYNNQLYAGGNFTTVNGQYSNHIASTTDGQNWTASPLGQGVNGPVLNLAALPNGLVASGTFSQALNSNGNVEVNKVALWNGSWQSLGQGFPDNGNGATAATNYNGQIAVGGIYDHVLNKDNSALQTNSIAVYNPSTGSWSQVGGGLYLTQPVNAVLAVNGNLYVGGAYTAVNNPGGVKIGKTYNVAEWNGQTWLPLGAGLGFNAGGYGAANSLASCNNMVYVGGTFVANDSNYNPVAGTNSIAAWDGSNWHALGQGIVAFNPVDQYGTVLAMACVSNNLYVAGNFLAASNNGSNIPNTSNLAVWNSSSNTWSAVSNTTIGNANQYISALTVVNQLSIH